MSGWIGFVVIVVAVVSCWAGIFTLAHVSSARRRTLPADSRYRDAGFDPDSSVRLIGGTALSLRARASWPICEIVIDRDHLLVGYSTPWPFSAVMGALRSRETCLDKHDVSSVRRGRCSGLVFEATDPSGGAVRFFGATKAVLACLSELGWEVADLDEGG